MAVEVVKFANGVLYRGGVAAGDNATVFTADQISECDSFLLMSTQGAMDVYPTLDGTNYATAPLSMTDMGATDLVPVLETAANRIYGFRGKFLGLRILQKGATAITAASLICGNVGSRW